ncbi:hypothetical protein C8Q73DRAFT_133141 [Cubamyces lactineus]|nr:hypothetical protein C8Q73DRAFT_133141 [Cubamyces lactineus]
MAPKRKRVEDGTSEGVTRATRASTRLKSTSSEPPAMQQGGGSTVGVRDSVEPSTKKPRRTATKAANTDSRSTKQQVMDFLMGTNPNERGSCETVIQGLRGSRTPWRDRAGGLRETIFMGRRWRSSRRRNG